MWRARVKLYNVVIRKLQVSSLQTASKGYKTGIRKKTKHKRSRDGNWINYLKVHTQEPSALQIVTGPSCAGPVTSRRVSFVSLRGLDAHWKHNDQSNVQESGEDQIVKDTSSKGVLTCCLALPLSVCSFHCAPGMSWILSHNLSLP